jgi:hypothetical protein
MIGDLPEIDDIFDESQNLSDKSVNSSLDKNGKIQISISKDGSSWMKAEFAAIAVAGIGLHIYLPMDIELTAKEINNLSIRFSRVSNEKQSIIKESPVLVRWQERDPKSGKLKLGVHFHGEIKEDIVIKELLEHFKENNS